MIVIPAIDLMDGKCVRLVQGKKDNLIAYEKTPMEIAEEYESKGIRLIHVVDLDGAFTGQMKNINIVLALAKRFPIQVGGGIRSESTIEKLLDGGVKKVIVSTLLFKDKATAAELKKKYFGKLVGSFDFKDGKLSYAGWTKKTNLTFDEVVNGLAEIVVTDVSRDGTLKGPNINLLKSLIGKCSAKIIAAGGVLDIFDLIELKQSGVYGAIVGRAFLEGRMKLRDGFLLEGENNVV